MHDLFGSPLRQQQVQQAEHGARAGLVRVAVVQF